MAVPVLMLAAGQGPLNFASAGADPSTPPQRVVRPDQTAPPARGLHPGVPAEDRARGKVWQGLAPGRADGPCAGIFEGEDSNGTYCTHGPDAAPAEVDVRQPRTNRQLAAAVASDTTAADTGPVPCYGDGTSGDRVQVIYARAADVGDRYTSVVDLLRQYAGNADQAFANSAAKTGGVRHVRWVTDAACSLVVDRVQLSTTGDDTFSAMSSELRSLGYIRADRKYLVLADAGVYCGIAGIQADDRNVSYNSSNDGPSFARVDRGCWGSSNSVEAHEIMHNLGGVQLSAPHSSGGYHCTDDSDRMCYADGGGQPMTYVCASTEERLFDCGSDDYFHTNPAPTSYLGTHWNSAMNDFLERVEPVGTPPPPTTTTTVPPSTTTTTTVAPPTTLTSTWSASFTKKILTRSYGLTTGAGTMAATSTFSGGSTETVVVKSSATGTVLGQNSGASPVSVSVPVSAGSYTVTVSGDRWQSYTLRVTYPRP